ncbi:hypothetical protein RB599_010694 [Gaeumannomyces hyphopodioides]
MSKRSARGLASPIVVKEKHLEYDLESLPSPMYIYQPLEKPRHPPPCPPLPLADSSLESRPTTRSREPMTEITAGVVLYWCEAYAWELLGLAVASGALAAIAVLAATSNGRPASVTALAAATGPFTLNALVALLATVGKGAMLSTVGLCMAQLKWARFTTRGGGGGSKASAPRPLSEFCAIDQASRGPVGSLAALPAIFAMPLVLVGALIMVVAVGFDFAAQQLISLEPRAVQPAGTLGETFVPRAQFFYHDDSGSQEWIPTVFAAGKGLVATIDNGCGGEPGVLDVAATCQTGNCTFPIFNTLAMCSKCVSIRDQLSRLALESRPGDSDVGRNDSTVYEIKWTAPGNATVVQRVVGLNSNGSTVNQTFVVSSFVGIQWPALGWPDYTIAPLGLTIMKFRSRPLAVDAVAAPPIGAWQCGISPCVRTLAVSVVNGRQHTSVLAEYKNDTQLATWLRQGGSYSLRPPPVSDKDLEESAAAAAAAMRTNSSRAGRMVIKDDENTPAPPMLQPNMLSEFEVSYAGMFLLSGVLKSFFAGTYELSHQKLVSDKSPVDLASGRGPYYLNATRDVPGLIGNVSDALTSYFRRQQAQSRRLKQQQAQRPSPFPPNANSTGPFQNTTTLPLVQQPPAAAAAAAATAEDNSGASVVRGAALVACTALLLAATAIYSSVRGAPMWKDSCLPMVFHGLDEAGLPVRFRGGKHTKGEMQAVAKDLNVAIRQDPASGQDRVRFMAEREMVGLRKG